MHTLCCQPWARVWGCPDSSHELLWTVQGQSLCASKTGPVARTPRRPGFAGQNAHYGVHYSTPRQCPQVLQHLHHSYSRPPGPRAQLLQSHALGSAAQLLLLEVLHSLSLQQSTSREGTSPQGVLQETEETRMHVGGVIHASLNRRSHHDQYRKRSRRLQPVLQ